jgi:hypothetical protein
MLADAATREPFDRMAARIIQQRGIAGVPVDVAPEAAARLEVWRTLHLEDLSIAGEQVAQQAAQALSRGTYSSKARTRLNRDLADIFDTAEPKIATLYDTAVSIYARQVEAEQAGDNPETAFAYMGPVDEKTRDFCLDYAGRVMTRAEIDDLDNGQLSNVFLTGGGYNCRHVWMEVSQFSELAPLVSTSKRVPEVMDAVREVRAQKEAA